MVDRFCLCRVLEYDRREARRQETTGATWTHPQLVERAMLTPKISTNPMPLHSSQGLRTFCTPQVRGRYSGPYLWAKAVFRSWEPTNPLQAKLWQAQLSVECLMEVPWESSGVFPLLVGWIGAPSSASLGPNSAPNQAPIALNGLSPLWVPGKGAPNFLNGTSERGQ